METNRTDARAPQHGEIDPHVWQDPINTIHMVQAIRDRLAQADPANARTYPANAEPYTVELRRLDAWIVDQVQTVPQERRGLVTSHNTFGYFARRYGFEAAGTALESSSTEAADPSGAKLAMLVENIKAAQVPAIFAENVRNPKLLERVAAAAGVQLAPPLYTDSLGKARGDGDTYLKMMRYNVLTIVQALKR